MAVVTKISPAAYAKMADKIKGDAQKLMRERRCASRVDAILAALLVQMGFSEDRSVCAVNADKRSIGAALDYLRNTTFAECLVCCGECAEETIVSVEPCKHRACQSCLTKHLRSSNNGRSSWICFACSVELDRHQVLNKLKPLLTREQWEELERRALQYCFEDDPEFRRCPDSQCGNGFYTDPQLQKAQCTQCRLVICNKCSSPWKREHENVTCEAFKEWKRHNDPDDPDFQAQEYMKSHGIECPGCRASFIVAKGGCAHLVCPKCKCEFCEGCRSTFARGEACTVGIDCKKKGMHAHHPRNCFVYTRDYPLEGLVNILQEDSVQIDIQLPTDDQLCSIMITGDDGDESRCPEKAHKADKCEKHYKEYLCTLILRNNVDTLSLMNVTQLQEELRKNGHVVPQCATDTLADKYREQLEEMIKMKVPLSM